MKKIFQVFVFDIFSKVLSAGSAIALIRFMSASEYASYTFALSVFAVITGSVVVSFSRIYVVGFRELSQEYDAEHILVLQLIATGGALILLAPLAFRMQETYWAVGLLVLANCLTEFARSVFQYELKFFMYSLIGIAHSGLFVLILGLLVYSEFELSASLVLLLRALIAGGTFLVFFGRRLQLPARSDIGLIRRLGGVIIRGEFKYLFAYLAVLALFAEVDVFTLDWLSTDFELATYGSAFRYYSIGLLAVGSLKTVLLPLVQHASSAREIEDLYRKHLRLLVLATPGFIVAGWLSQWLIPLVDQGAYPDAVLTFQILAASAWISLLFSPHSSLLFRFHDFRYLLLLFLAGLFILVGMNIVLIPIYGSVGAAVSTLIGFAIVNGGTFLRAEIRRKTMIFGEMPKGDA